MNKFEKSNKSLNNTFEEVTLEPDREYELVAYELYEVYLAKNADYGNSFDESLDEFGLIASIVRLGDKYRRLVTLGQSDEQYVDDESIRDTLTDLANYAIMTVRYMDMKAHEDELLNIEGFESIDESDGDESRWQMNYIDY